jgi:uroporphyrinogen-III synthase
MNGDRPLTGRRILVTRPRDQSGRLQQLLEAQGAHVIAIPSVEILPPDSYADLDAALQNLDRYDWLVLTSANAVKAIAERVALLGVSTESFRGVQIAAIGRTTADAIVALGLPVALVPPVAVAESLSEVLLPLVPGKRVLIVRAKIAREVLTEALRSAGALVSIAEAYQSTVPAASVNALAAALEQGVDAMTFTSASSVENLAILAQRAGATILPGVKKVSIGPITTHALREKGWFVDAEASAANMDELVAAVIGVFA